MTDNKLSRMFDSRTAKLRVVLCVTLAMTSGCLVRRRVITQPTARQKLPELKATKDELVAELHEISDPIRSFQMRADLSPSILEPSKGAATDYATVTAYILFLRPGYLRVIAKDPVLGTTIFDMVSDGAGFRASIPPKNRFIIGSNNAPEHPKNKLENLRPKALLTSLIVSPPAPEEITILENDLERSEYILQMIEHSGDGFSLARQVYFDGRTLRVLRQKTFDGVGGVVSDTTYAGWKGYDKIGYPSQIDILRPKENYEVQLTLTNMKMNPPDITPAKFVLQQPPGAHVQVLK